MKRWSCILLICMLFVQLLPGVQASENQDARELETLIGLEILSGYSAEAFNPNGYVSAGAYANAVLNLIQDEEVFDNIATEHSIQLAKERLLLEGIKDFQKQRTVLGHQALDILLRGLGYKMLLDNGQDVVTAASGVGINTAGLGAETPLTNAKMVSLLYDALEVHPFVFDMDSYQVDEDMTILERFRKITKVEGIVTQNSYTDLTDTPVSGDAHLVIDGVHYAITNEADHDLLGLRVEAYVKELEHDDQLVYARPYRNEILSIKREDVESVDDAIRMLEYEQDGRIKREKISPTVKVIYNGTAYTDYEVADFKAGNGQITMIDNDRDGIYDVVKITAYKTMIVKSVSSFDGVITNRYTYDAENQSYTVDMDNDETEYIIVRNGKVSSFNEIMARDVLQIAEAKGTAGKRTFIYASSQVADGDLTATADEEHTVCLDEKAYTLSDAYLLAEEDPLYTQLIAGSRYRFYLDTFGRVAYAEELLYDVVSYGFMTKLFRDENTDRYYVQLFATDGQWHQYMLRENIRYNGEKTADKVVFADLTNEQEVLSQKQMIRYRTNKASEISLLDTAQLANGYVEDQFTQFAVNELEYRSECGWFINSDVYLNSDAVIMMLPEDLADKSGYTVKNVSWLTNGRNVSCTVYDMDEWGKSSLLTVVNDEAAGLKAVENADLCVVESVREVLTSDETVCQQVVLHQPFYGKVTLLSDDKNRFTGMLSGDIVQIATDVNSKVTAARVLYSVSEGDKKVWSAGGNFRNATTLLSGTVLDIDAEKRMIKMDCGEEHILPLVPPDYYRPFDVIIYDTKTDRVERGNIYDIRMGDYVVADMSWYLIGNVVIYR